MTVRYQVCTQCGKDKTPSTWKFCSFKCKERRTQEFTGKGANTRRAKTVARLRFNPIAQAIATEDGPTILQAIHDICTVSPAGCWIPNPSFGPDGERQVYDSGGYRRIMVAGSRTVSLHRVTLEASTGTSLGSTPVHHTCAVRACCNPEHLQPTTLIENNLEMMERIGYRKRIADLESALRELRPDHPLLWAD